MLKDYIQKHPRKSVIIGITVFVITIVCLSLLVKSGDNSNSNSNSITPGSTSGDSGMSDTQKQAMKNYLNITNYTDLDPYVGPQLRNSITNAVQYSLANNISTKNGAPIDYWNNNPQPDSTTTDSQLYPMINYGGYFEATIDKDSIQSTGDWDYTFTLTTTKDKHIKVHVNFNPKYNIVYSRIDVTLLN